MATRIVTNAIACRKCGEIIESNSVHDFRSCACGAVKVDGGREYLRRIGDPDSMIEMSYTVET